MDCIINSSPKFIYEEIKDDTYRQYDYHLTPSSPAIGSADVEIASQVPVDLDGNERLLDGVPDIGCYEYKQ